ncbi:MAG: hypothetical protein M3Q79_03740 [bacterium]|nr:hypothetical protein [bacterium]
MEHKQSVALPASVASPVEVGRMLREAEKINDFLEQAAVRKTGEPMILPKTSRLLDDLIQVNGKNMLQAEDRKYILQVLRKIKKDAPVVHMSFSADPSPQFMLKMIEWLRSNIHPFVLVRVGLQPNIGAGCVMRTTNKHFDFSLRQHFNKHYQYFVDKLHEVVEMEDKVPAVAQPAVQEPAA